MQLKKNPIVKKKNEIKSLPFNERALHLSCEHKKKSCIRTLLNMQRHVMSTPLWKKLFKYLGPSVFTHYKKSQVHHRGR